MNKFHIETHGPGLYDITKQAQTVASCCGAASALLTLFIRHSSASLLIQENADPTVQQDLLDFFDRLAPQTDHYAHATEGPDDMPAHIKSALTAVSLSIPIENSKLMLGTWQGVYLFEHRNRPHRRSVLACLSPTIAPNNCD